MKRKNILYITLAILVLGVGAWYIVTDIQKQKANQQSASEFEKLDENKSSDNRFATLQGEAYDEAYVANMIMHHEGAVQMAEQALAVSERQEIRSLSNDIISTQSDEIVKMRTWQNEWGYEQTASMGHGNHGGGSDSSTSSMESEMADMMSEMATATGDEFDRIFIEQMIIHHQQAVDMSKFAETNAYRDEIKALAKDVISAQEKEIASMKQWQRNWGFTQQ